VLLLIQTWCPLARCFQQEEIGFYHGPAPSGPSVTNKATVNRAVTFICGPQGDPPRYKTSKTPAGMLSSPSSDSYLALTMPSLPSSPAKHTLNSAGRFSSVGKPPVKQLCDDMDNEMRRSFLGPMPVQQFFQKFLPGEAPPNKVKASLSRFAAVAEAKNETEMYDKFVRCPFHPVYFSFSVVFLWLGRRCESMRWHNQSIQLVEESGPRIRRGVQARHRFL